MICVHRAHQKTIHAIEALVCWTIQKSCLSVSPSRSLSFVLRTFGSIIRFVWSDLLAGWSVVNSLNNLITEAMAYRTEPSIVRHGTLTGTVADTPCPESDPCFTCLCMACKPESQTGTTSLNFLSVHTTSAGASLSGHFNFGMPNWQVVGLGPRGSQNMWSIITRCTLLVRSLQHAMCAFHVIALCAQRILQVRYHMTQQTRVIRARPSRCL